MLSTVKETVKNISSIVIPSWVRTPRRELKPLIKAAFERCKLPLGWDSRKPRLHIKVAYEKGDLIQVDTWMFICKFRLTKAGIKIIIIGCCISSYSLTPFDKWGRMENEGYFIWQPSPHLQGAIGVGSPTRGTP